MYAALFAQAAETDFQKQIEMQQKLFGTPAGIVNQICFWGCVICCVAVIVFMFRKGSTGLGIGSIIGTVLCCCPGFLITLIMGWVKSGQWNILWLMLIYTLLFLGWIGSQAYLTMQAQELAKSASLLL